MPRSLSPIRRGQLAFYTVLLVIGCSIFLILLTVRLAQPSSKNQQDKFVKTAITTSQPESYAVTDKELTPQITTALSATASSLTSAWLQLNPNLPTVQAKNSVRIPVLTYHHVAPIPAKSAPDYYVTPEVFEQQLAFLAVSGYQTLTPDEYYNYLQAGKNPERKSVLLTFDDGASDNYRYAFPLLKKYGFSGTFAIVSSRSGISSAQLKEMAQAGMVIASHTSTHPDLTKIDPAALASELAASRAALQAMSKSQVDILVYPGCMYNKEVVAAARAAGYKMAFTCGSRIDNKFNQRYALYRIHIYDKLEDFKARLVGISRYPY